MPPYVNIALIGAGNLAWHLAPALENIGHRISLLYNRTAKHGHQLTGRLYNTSIKKDLNFSRENVNVIIIAVQDSAVTEIVSNIVIPDHALLIHTSGALSLQVLERSAASHTGVFYPLQTFTKNMRIDFRNIPLCVEANSDYGKKILLSTAKGLSKSVYELNSEQRKVLHLSAVMTANFSNHLITIAGNLLRERELDQSLLFPLLQATIDKVFTMGPEAGQTGPAKREDHETIDLHLELLQHDEDLMEIYSVLSNHIMKYYRRS